MPFYPVKKECYIDKVNDCSWFSLFDFPNTTNRYGILFLYLVQMMSQDTYDYPFLIDPVWEQKFMIFSGHPFFNTNIPFQIGYRYLLVPKVHLCIFQNYPPVINKGYLFMTPLE